ncbi:MAG: hypothetical protein ACLURP_08610 [Ruminococcus sp.]
MRINEAEAEVARFNAMYEEYVKNPETTKMRMFYETMEDVLPGIRKIVTRQRKWRGKDIAVGSLFPETGKQKKIQVKKRNKVKISI